MRKILVAALLSALVLLLSPAQPAKACMGCPCVRILKSNCLFE